MKRGESGELIVKGQTEAGVVSHFFDELNVNDSRFRFEPPLVVRPMGRLAFINSRIEDFFGTSDRTEYVVSNPIVAELTTQILLVASIGPLDFTPQFLSRRAFLEKRVMETMMASTES